MLGWRRIWEVGVVFSYRVKSIESRNGESDRVLYQNGEAIRQNERMLKLLEKLVDSHTN